MADARKQNMELLESLGFEPATWLPEKRSDAAPSLRPIEEIAGRLAVLKGVFMWAAAPQEHVPDAVIHGYLQGNGLMSLVAGGQESQVLSLPRAEAHKQFCNRVGWRLENMWPLAWVLGFDREPDVQGMIPQQTILAMIQFAPFKIPLAQWLSQCRLRSIAEVDRLEDLFYCAHNAVRSAQAGGKTVPPGFDPMVQGGAIYERRHSLTWALSPGVAWDDTDVST